MEVYGCLGKFLVISGIMLFFRLLYTFVEWYVCTFLYEFCKKVYEIL